MSSKFSEKIKELRLNNSMTQADLAKLLNMSKMGISHWETSNKEPNYDTLIEIAKLFDVTTDYLLGLED